MATELVAPYLRTTPTPDSECVIFGATERKRISTETSLPQQARDAEAMRPVVGLEHVRAHTGIVANEHVDILATKVTGVEGGSEVRRIFLIHGRGQLRG